MPRNEQKGLITRDKQLAHAREREGLVSTGIGTFSALLPDAAALLFSTVEMVHPAITVLTVGGRLIASHKRQAPQVEFSRSQRIIYAVEDVFSTNEAMSKKLNRWQDKQFRKLNREEGAAKRRIKINNFMRAIGYPIETIVPVVYAYLSKVPHNAQENFFQAVPDVLHKAIQINQDNPFLQVHPNIPVLAVGIVSGVAAVVAGGFQQRAEQNYIKILEDERIQVPQIADKYYNEHIVTTTPAERVMNSAVAGFRRIRRPWQRQPQN